MPLDHFAADILHSSSFKRIVKTKCLALVLLGARGGGEKVGGKHFSKNLDRFSSNFWGKGAIFYYKVGRVWGIIDILGQNSGSKLVQSHLSSRSSVPISLEKVPSYVDPLTPRHGTCWHCHIPDDGALLSPHVEIFRGGTNEGYPFWEPTWEREREKREREREREREIYIYRERERNKERKKERERDHLNFSDHTN